MCEAVIREYICFYCLLWSSCGDESNQFLAELVLKCRGFTHPLRHRYRGALISSMLISSKLLQFKMSIHIEFDSIKGI